jgi:heparan-alpha-glucosaminide N-acetyltransferase
LNLFPRPDGKAYERNGGGYQTLNFLPSIGTMLLGLLAGGLLQSRVGKWKKLMYLILAGAACMAIALPMGWFLCPVVKRIWTPSWVLFSGAWVLWGLAIFYLLFDLLPLRWLAFPLVVVGMNSLVMYMMGQLLRPWITRMMSIHLDWLVNSQTTFGRYVSVYEYGTALLAMWLICYWMYRKKLFVRV